MEVEETDQDRLYTWWSPGVGMWSKEAPRWRDLVTRVRSQGPEMARRPRWWPVVRVPNSWLGSRAEPVPRPWGRPHPAWFQEMIAEDERQRRATRVAG